MRGEVKRIIITDQRLERLFCPNCGSSMEEMPVEVCLGVALWNQPTRKWKCHSCNLICYEYPTVIEVKE